MSTEPKVAAIIQARMSSSRLPGKVMMDLAGKPVLWHVFHRLRKSKLINQIILATTTDSCDDALEQYAREQGINVVRGSRDNVLARFAMAVERFDPDYIVRVTSDCPMVDPWAIDALTEALIRDKADIAGWQPNAVTLHGGFEPISRATFDRIVRDGWNDPIAQEHVVGYLGHLFDTLKVAGVPAPANHIFDEVRLWLDTPADMELLRTLYARTGAAPGDIAMDDVAEILHTDPTVKAINMHVRQKAPDERSAKVIIRCDGGVKIGMGHISRMLSLATALREHFAIGVVFALMTDRDAQRLIQDANFPCVLAPEDANEADWLDEEITRQKANGVIFDIRTPLSAHAMNAWRPRGIKCILIDDITDRLGEADLAFMPPTPQTLALTAQNPNPDHHVGWDWLLLKPEITRMKAAERPHNPTPRLLVSCGASDPGGFTLLALEALNSISTPVDIDVIAGPWMPGRDALRSAADAHRHTVRIHDVPPNMAELMVATDLSIVSFGVTASEMAALGVPAIYLALTPDHAQSAAPYEEQGLGINLGVFARDGVANLSATVERLLADGERLRTMSQTAQRVIDGLGAQRVAAKIADRVMNG